jgi:hypothetical protein
LTCTLRAGPPVLLRSFALAFEELSRTSDRQRLLQFVRRWLYDHKRGYIAKASRSSNTGPSFCRHFRQYNQAPLTTNGHVKTPKRAAFAAHRRAIVFSRLPVRSACLPMFLWTKYWHFWHGNQGYPAIAPLFTKAALSSISTRPILTMVKRPRRWLCQSSTEI